MSRYINLCIFILCLGVVLYVLYFLGPEDYQTWLVITAVLAVLAAVVNSENSRKVLELEEIRLRPDVVVYLDHKSRNHLFLFRVENIGVSPAYDIHIDWIEPLVGRDGAKVSFSENKEVDIPCLLAKQSLSKAIGAIHKFMSENKGKIFKGKLTYYDVSRKKYEKYFNLSLDELEGTLLHDSELSLTYEAIQKIPKQIEKLEAVVKMILQKNI